MLLWTLKFYVTYFIRSSKNSYLFIRNFLYGIKNPICIVFVISQTYTIYLRIRLSKDLCFTWLHEVIKSKEARFKSYMCQLPPSSMVDCLREYISTVWIAYASKEICFYQEKTLNKRKGISWDMFFRHVSLIVIRYFRSRSKLIYT